jgi:predicted ribosomally synthesized peptide with SipW-like signal peptide
MKKKLTAIIASCIMVIVAITTATVTLASFSDSETATANLFTAGTPAKWTQTTRSDFENGLLNGVDTASNPDNVVLSAAGTNSWYNSSWNYRKKITIAHTRVSSDLSGFPVLINLSADSDLHTYALSSANDILFTSADGTTKLAHEIERYTSSSGALTAWVNIPGLSSTADTVLYMYYGNASASSQQNATAVWDSNFLAVWHMDETTGTSVGDSTTHGNNGTPTGVTLNTTGINDGADGFNGTSAYTSLGTGSSLNFAANSAFTIDGWFNLNSGETYAPLVSLRNSSTASGGDNSDIDICIGYDGGVTDSGKLMGLVRPDSGGNYARITGPSVSVSAWHYFTLTRDATTSGNIELYADGAFIGTASAGAGSGGSITTNIRALASERRWVQDGSGTATQRYLAGSMDEVRISASLRTSDWVSTSYNNQSSPATFYALGAAEQKASLILFWDGAAAPAGWTIVSDASGEAFYNVFPRGAETYGGTGGNTSHTHTASIVSVSTPVGTVTVQSGSSNSATSSTHTHALSGALTVGSGSNLPVFRNLKVIQYNGIPSTIPAGAIAMFESIPSSGWTRYAAQDGSFIQGGADATTTGGSNTHVHSINGTLSSTTAVLYNNNGSMSIARNTHTHTISGNSSAADTLPPFVTVILARADAATAIPGGMIGMFTATPQGAWNVLSGAGGIFNNAFLVGSDAFGTTGGNSTHPHSNFTLTSGAPNLLRTNAVSSSSGIQVGSSTHTHTLTVTLSAASTTELPPYIDVVIAIAGNSGAIASAVLTDGNTGSKWNALFWDGSIPAGTGISFEVRASDSSFNKDDATLTWTALPGSSPKLSGLPPGKYKQWRATLTTGDGTSTPVLSEVRLYYYP